MEESSAIHSVDSSIRSVRAWCSTPRTRKRGAQERVGVLLPTEPPYDTSIRDRLRRCIADFVAEPEVIPWPGAIDSRFIAAIHECDWLVIDIGLCQGTGIIGFRGTFTFGKTALRPSRRRSRSAVSGGNHAVRRLRSGLHKRHSALVERRGARARNSSEAVPHTAAAAAHCQRGRCPNVFSISSPSKRAGFHQLLGGRRGQSQTDSQCVSKAISACVRLQRRRIDNGRASMDRRDLHKPPAKLARRAAHFRKLLCEWKL